MILYDCQYMIHILSNLLDSKFSNSSDSNHKDPNQIKSYLIQFNSIRIQTFTSLVFSLKN